MSWVTIIWSMVVSTCLTQAGIHLLVWCKNRRAGASLAFAILAVAVAFTAAGELLGMRTQTPAQAAANIRWIEVPLFFLATSLVCFVHLSFRTGRVWLGAIAVGLRGLQLVLNFVTGPNILYREVLTIRQVELLGERVTVVGEAIPNPWVVVDYLSSLFLLVFVIDATLRLWRSGGRENRRLAWVIGGPIIGFILVAVGYSALINQQVVQTPYLISLPFLAIVLVMAYELSRDLIESAELSTELRESQEAMKLATEAAKLALWNWDIQNDHIWITAEGRQLHGLPPEGEVGWEQFLVTIQAEDQASLSEVVDGSLRGEGGFSAEYRVVLPDGTQRWVHAQGRTEFDHNKKPLRMRGMSFDISDRKFAEMDAQHSRNELAHVGRVATMGHLATSLAHELNQPLGAILRNAEAAELFMQDPSPDLDEVRAILSDIRKDDLRAGQVIDRMRAMVRQRKVDRRPLDLAHLLNEVVALMRTDIELHRVQLTTETGSSLPLVLGDRVQLQQVLINLILNAIDAMGGNPPEARLIAVRVLLSESVVEISVSDMGHGIPEEKFKELFEPFSSSKPHGLGMGLTISRSIIEAHGGRLGAQNNPSGGATFTLSLPMAAGDSAG